MPSSREPGTDAADLDHVAVLAALISGRSVTWQAARWTPESFFDLCAEHGVVGLVHQHLRHLPQDTDWPPAVRRRVADAARAEGAIEVLCQRETAAVLAELAAAGIYPVLLKGAGLAHSVYAVAGTRPTSDTDLLIPRREVDAVRAVLTRMGYSALAFSDGELLLCQFVMIKKAPWSGTHAFDVHWKISTQPVFAHLLTYEEIVALAGPVPALGPHALMPIPVHALLLACIHPVMHHRGAERLIWVHDIHLLASRLSAAEFETFAEFALRRRIAAVCASSLAVAAARFGTVIPDGVTGRLAAAGDDEPSAAYLRSGRRWHHDVMSGLRELPRWRDRLQLIREVLVPSSRYMLDAYGFAQSPLAAALVPALHVHRVTRGLVNVMVGRK